MNQKFKALAEAAGFKTDMLPGGFPNESLLALQDFYESIVKECIASIRALDNDAPYDEWTSGYTSAIISAAEAVEECFGIKE